MRLSDAKVGEVLKIINIDIEHEKIKQRFLDMGMVKDTMVKIKKVAPLGDPIIIEFRSYELCIGKKDAAFIIVRKI